MRDVPAVANAVRVLERLASAWPEPLPVATLTEELGIYRSTCYNILGTLEKAGWAMARGSRSGWSLGPRLLALAVREDAVSAIVQRELDSLGNQLGFVVFTVRQSGSGEYLVIAKAERGQGVRVTVSVGDKFPFSAPAIMQAYYAWSASDQFTLQVRRHGISEFTPYTVTDISQVRGELERTRERGYGVSIQEYDLAQSGIAAPIFDARGRVTMVLCTLGFSSELTDNNAKQVGEMVRDAAVRITTQTGGWAPGQAQEWHSAR